MYQNNPSNYFMSRSNSNLCVHLCTSLHADRKQGSFILLIIHCNIKTAVTKIVLNLKNKKNRTTWICNYNTIYFLHSLSDYNSVSTMYLLFIYPSTTEIWFSIMAYRILSHFYNRVLCIHFLTTFLTSPWRPSTNIFYSQVLLKNNKPWKCTDAFCKYRSFKN